MSLIQLHEVTKSYNTSFVPVIALNRITITIDRQAFISFIGPSGSGKSTLLNIIGALDKPTGGTIIVDDVDIAKLDRSSAAAFRGSIIGFVFQNFNLIPVLTVFENVEYPLLILKNSSVKDRKAHVLNLLDKVGMLDQKDKFPNQISGGQKQRVAVARALVANPKIVLADEPTANLDHASAFKVIALMHEMQKTFGTTFVFSTHDPKIVEEAELIYTLEDGAIVNHKAKT
ncbi:MAG: ABC transporter ATP-binding protein [Bacteroidota bacterium]